MASNAVTHHKEPRYPLYLTILLMVTLQIAITDRLTIGPKYLLAGFELLLLLVVALAHGSGKESLRPLKRHFSYLLIILVSVTNIASLVLVVSHLIGGDGIPGHTLLLSALDIYLTNILVFGFWYWEMDSPGLSGYQEPACGPDFLFPQMSVPDLHPAVKNFEPEFYDYIYISVTNATAFSPTDALPLTHRAKFLMSVQSLASLATVALVAARAVNILN